MHSTLESHLHTQCPNCGLEHDKSFSSVYDLYNKHAHHLSLQCTNCDYEIYIRTTDNSGF